MPGPVSDAYDPEWGTRANADEIRKKLDRLYEQLSSVLGYREPIFVLDLVRMQLPDLMEATFTERDWRLLRFCVERARDSL